MPDEKYPYCRLLLKQRQHHHVHCFESQIPCSFQVPPPARQDNVHAQNGFFQETFRRQ